MRYLTIYDSTKTYLFNNMMQATPEKVAEDYTSVGLGIPCVIETDVTGIMFKTAPMPLPVLAGQYNIDITDLTDDEVVSAIEDAMNIEETVSTTTEPTAEERIAAALEYQNLLSTIATAE